MNGKNLLITAAIITVTANIFTALAQVRTLQPEKDTIIYETKIFYPVNVNYMTGTTDGVSLTDTSEVRGEDTEDGWFSFDVSSIPGESTIDSIRFYGFVNNTDSTNWSLTPLPLDPGYNSPEEIKEYIEEHSDSSMAYAYITLDSAFTTGWHNCLLGNGATGDLQSSLSTGGRFRVGMDSRDNSPGHYIKWDGWAQPNIPHIKVSYHKHWLWDYFENFDNMSAGFQVACQDPVHWTTWNLMPCSWADPYVTNYIYYSPPNSVMITGGNDLIQSIGVTSGPWLIEFWFYIASGRSGYFEVMAEFFGEPKIPGMECFFDGGGFGRLVIGDTTIDFNWQEDTWQIAQVWIDLDYDDASFGIGTSRPAPEIASWYWTRNGTIPRKLDAVNFFGSDWIDEMFFDDYRILCLYIPVELNSFHADAKSGNVILRWETATETNNYGFEVQRSGVRDQRSDWEKIGFVEGSGTTTEPKSYSFTDGSVVSGKYSYRLKQIDFDGSFEYSKEVEVEVNVPLEFSLRQNYPNPFNPSTTIGFSIPKEVQVNLSVYNILGEKVKELKNEVMKPSSYEVEFDASTVASGVYFYIIKAGDIVQTKKMLFLK